MPQSPIINTLGVTKLKAGSGISLSPSVGTGIVTVTATGGGGAGGVITLEQFSGGVNASPAANDAALASAIALSSSNGIPVSGLNEAGQGYKISATVHVPSGAQINNLGLQMQTNNIPIMSVIGNGICMENIQLSYATQQTSADTNAIGLLLGNGSSVSSQFCYYSCFKNFGIYFTYKGMATNPGTAGEFQNHYDTFDIQHFSYAAVYLSPGSSGSVWTNLFIHNSQRNPPSTDCTYCLYMNDYTNAVFNFLDIESAYPSTWMLSFNNNCLAVINGFHVEAVSISNVASGYCLVSFGSTLVVNTFAANYLNVLQTSPFFYVYSGNSPSGTSTLEVHGFLSKLNTYFSTYLFAYQATDDLSNIRITGWMFGQMDANVQIQTRNSLRQFENYYFTAGGLLVSGLVGTTPPTGAMPTPFADGGTSLQWQVGDRMDNSAVTASTNPSWYCTTAGSPGTWTASPNL